MNTLEAYRSELSLNAFAVPFSFGKKKPLGEIPTEIKGDAQWIEEQSKCGFHKVLTSLLINDSYGLDFEGNVTQTAAVAPIKFSMRTDEYLEKVRTILRFLKEQPGKAEDLIKASSSETGKAFHENRGKLPSVSFWGTTAPETGISVDISTGLEFFRTKFTPDRPFRKQLVIAENVFARDTIQAYYDSIGMPREVSIQVREATLFASLPEDAIHLSCVGLPPTTRYEQEDILKALGKTLPGFTTTFILDSEIQDIATSKHYGPLVGKLIDSGWEIETDQSVKGNILRIHLQKPG